MNKSILVALLVVAASLPVKAQVSNDQTSSPTLTIPVVNGSLDLGSLVKELHPVYVFDQHRDSLAGADIHVLTIHSADGTEWAHTCGGVIWRTSDGIGGPMFSERIRWDNVWGNAVGSAWAKGHVNAIKLPQVEAGPFGGYINRLGWLYGVTAALAFGN